MHGQCASCSDGIQDKLTLPVEVQILSGLGLKQASAGLAHSVVRTKTGSVYVWGWNEDGQLGLGHEASSQCPVLVEGELSDLDVQAVHCGARHTVVMTTDGKAFGWGSNKWGQIEKGETGVEKILEPKKFKVGKFKVASVACGWWSTTLLLGGVRNGLIESGL